MPGRSASPSVVCNTFLTNVAGDLNAKHSSFKSPKSLSKSSSLRRSVVDDPRFLVIGLHTPTHFPHQGSRPHVLDIHIGKDVPRHTEVTAVSNLSSDHDLLLTTMFPEHLVSMKAELEIEILEL